MLIMQMKWTADHLRTKILTIVDAKCPGQYNRFSEEWFVELKGIGEDEIYCVVLDVNDIRSLLEEAASAEESSHNVGIGSNAEQCRVLLRALRKNSSKENTK